MSLRDYVNSAQDTRRNAGTLREYAGFAPQPTVELPGQMRQDAGGTVQDDSAHRTGVMPVIPPVMPPVDVPQVPRTDIVPDQIPASTTAQAPLQDSTGPLGFLGRDPVLPDQPMYVERKKSLREYATEGLKGAAVGLAEGVGFENVEPGLGGSPASEYLYEHGEDPAFQTGRTVGNLAGYLAPLGRAYKVGAPVGKAALNMLKGRGKAVVEPLARGLTAGAVTGTYKEAGKAATTDEGFDIGRVGTEAALFGGGDALLAGAGRLGKKALDAYRARRAARVADEYANITGGQPVPEAQAAQRQAMEMIGQRKALPAPGAPEYPPIRIDFDARPPQQPAGLLPPVTSRNIQQPSASPYNRAVAKDIQGQLDKARGREILDGLSEKGVTPQEVANRFWDETYDNLPAEAQRKINAMVRQRTGAEPGARYKDWKQIGREFSDFGDDVELLEGTDRGFVSLMAHGNERFGGRAAQGATVDIPKEKIKWDAGSTPAPSSRSPVKPAAKSGGGEGWEAKTAVSRKGKPVPVYHGSSNTFDKFEVARSEGVDNLVGGGVYFTESKDIARSYMNKGVGESPSLREVFLDIRKPLDFDAAPTKSFKAEFLERVDNEYGSLPRDERARLIRTKHADMYDFVRDANIGHTGEAMLDESFTMILDDMGYDGITHIGGRGGGEQHRVWVALDESAIKYPETAPSPKPTPKATPKEKIKPDAGSTPAPSKKLPEVEPPTPKKALSITGPVLGFETDEEGNINYNVTVGLMGLAGTAGLAAVGRTPLMRERMRATWNTTKRVAKDIGRPGKKVPDKGYIATPADARTTFTARKAEFEAATQNIGKKAFASMLEENPLTGAKDVSSIETALKDIFRNVEKVTKGEQNPVYKALIDPIENAKGMRIDFTKRLADMLDRAQKRTGIKPHTKAGDHVIHFMEGKVTKKELAAKFGEQKAKDIMSMARMHRAMYDFGIRAYNGVSDVIYKPTEKWAAVAKGKDVRFFETKKAATEWAKGKKGYAVEKMEVNPHRIAYKSDFYPHYARMGSDIQAISRVYDVPTKIDPKLEGISAYTKPFKRFFGSELRRTGARKKYDMNFNRVMLNYFDGAGDHIFLSPQVSRVRAFRDALAEHTADSKNVNNFIRFLDQWANDIARKTNPFDRATQDILGRRVTSAITWGNQRIKANAILGNASSVIAQAGNIPQAIGATRGYSVVGLQDAMAWLARANTDAVKAMRADKWLKERYIGKSLRKFDTGWLGNPKYLKRIAQWAMESTDEIATKFIWFSFYRKALGEGVKNPRQYAMRWTRKMVTGRGIGEVPLLQKSKMFQIVAPFTVEVMNQWWAASDMIRRSGVRGKASFAAVPAFLLSSFLFNRAWEEMRGSGVSLDPLEALYNGVRKVRSDPQLDTLEKVGIIFGHLAGEALSNLPGGQYPSYLLSDKTAEKYLGEHDPAKFTRYGASGLPGVLPRLGKSPLYALVPPFGGTQLERSIAGYKSFSEGKATKKDGSYMYDIPQDFEHFIRTIVFGRHSTPAAREYYDDKEFGKKKTTVPSVGGRARGREQDRGRSRQ